MNFGQYIEHSQIFDYQIFQYENIVCFPEYRYVKILHLIENLIWFGLIGNLTRMACLIILVFLIKFPFDLILQLLCHHLMMVGHQLSRMLVHKSNWSNIFLSKYIIPICIHIIYIILI